MRRVKKTISKEFDGKKVLITGSSGFIGRHLKKALPFATGLSTKLSDSTDIASDVRTYPIHKENYDVIFHLAAVVGTELSIRKPVETYSTNICGTLNVLRDFKGLLVFTSTVGVFSPLKNPYFLSKYVCEEMVKASQCEHLIFRLSNPYGPGSKSVVQKWIESDTIKIYGDGKQIRDFVFIGDLVEILADPFRYESNKTYNIGTGIPVTLNELAQKIVALFGSKKIEYLPAREFEIEEPVIMPDIECKTNIEEGLKKSLHES